MNLASLFGGLGAFFLVFPLADNSVKKSTPDRVPILERLAREVGNLNEDKTTVNQSFTLPFRELALTSLLQVMTRCVRARVMAT